MNKEEEAFQYLLNDYFKVPQMWDDYQTIEKAIKENKILKSRNELLKRRIDKATEKINEMIDNSGNLDEIDKANYIIRILNGEGGEE